MEINISKDVVVYEGKRYRFLDVAPNRKIALEAKKEYTRLGWKVRMIPRKGSYIIVGTQ